MDYVIDEDNLMRLMDACCKYNSCIDSDNNVTDSCICYSLYSKELSKELLPIVKEDNEIK